MFGRAHTFNGGEIPRLVCVETTNHCNAVCPFCPNNALSRHKTHMTDDLFAKIIEDCRQFPLEAIEPFMQGEPFSDPKIIERMEHIRRRLPDTKLRLYSNGNALTPKKIDQLVGLGIDHLFISVNTLDPEKYREIMGLKLEKTLENLAYLTDPARKDKIAPKITFRMTRMENTTLGDQDQFLAYCRERKVKPLIVGLFNYKGDVGTDLPIPNYPCEHITRLDILASGKVTLCCQDQDAEYGWGDVNTHSVLEVYRGKVASEVRRMHREGLRKDLEPCNTCNLFWPSLEGMPALTTAKFAVQAGAYFLKHRPNGRKPPRPIDKPIHDGKLEQIRAATLAQKAAERAARNAARERTAEEGAG